jgi:hypothetical protein
MRWDEDVVRRETQTLVSILMKGLADQVRGDKPGKLTVFGGVSSCASTTGARLR